MTTSTQKFSEFISQDEEGNIRMRLGHSTYFEKGRHIYVVNKDGTEQLITPEVHATKPWIRENLSLIHISEPTRRHHVSRMPSSA